MPATPETVALYLTSLAETHACATISRRLTSITKGHEASQLPSPAGTHLAIVGETLKGIRRTLGTAQPGKQLLLTADLLKVPAHLGDKTIDLRDRALLLTGFAAGMRRSEIAALDVNDVSFLEAGAVVTLRRSKTDEEGQGRKVALPWGTHPETCPVRALQSWIETAGIDQGALFRAVDRHGNIGAMPLHADSVGAIVKKRIASGGYDAEAFGGHSLRAGFATQAAMNGATELAIMKQTGHRSLPTLRRYIRDGQLFRDTAAEKLGL